MTLAVDMVGRRFGRLTVLRKSAVRMGKFMCRCDCGNIAVVIGGNLRRGNTTSCGCRHSEIARSNIKHGMARGGQVSPEHACWSAMLSRCENPNDAAFDAYGGAGVEVCEAWHSFVKFYADVVRRPSPNHSLDRYPNPHGNYEPGNVRWATAQQQSRNRRTNVLVQYRGRQMCLAEACELAGIKYGTAYMRMQRGWSAAEIFGG